jgi:Aldo/keto reductase family
MAFKFPEDPDSLLGWYRQLAPTAGVKVSPLCLGAMNLGTAWQEFMGGVDEKASFELLDYFYKNGGNFVDTASNYQEEQSEIIIGNWMKARGNRDEMVIATKYTTGWRTALGDKIIQANFGGMNAKNLRHSLEASLKKLQTTFVDILYIHWWDNSADVGSKFALLFSDSCADVGPDTRGNACSERRGPARQSHICRNIRHPGMGGSESQRVRSWPQPTPVRCLSRQMECDLPRHGEGDTSYVQS